MEKKKIYIIGIGGIGVSAIARYYNEKGYSVFGSDACNSELIENLKNEGIDIIIGSNESRIDITFEKIIYTEAIPDNQEELKISKEYNIPLFTYPEALAEIANKKRLIAVAGTHGKSTTTSLISIMMKKSSLGINAVIGTLLKEFDGKNTYFSESEFFAIEACEYKRSFLKYKPEFLVITNIEVDHLDYYKDESDYISAYKELILNMKSGGYVIYNGQDKNCLELVSTRDDINYISVNNGKYNNGIEKNIESLHMKIPGDHILFDAQLGYTLGKILGIQQSEIISGLESYNGVWRRMEIIGKTIYNNTIISDYGHHPTEIKLTLGAIKNKYSDKKIITIFQPHQYNRTLELLEDFKTCFSNTDTLIIPNIYESRDSQEDKDKINAQILLDEINHDDKIHGVNLDYTKKIINKLDKDNKNDALFIIMGAGDVDNLRYNLEIKK